MPVFTVGVNIGAKLGRGFRSAFQQARQTANFAGRSIERSGRNAAAGFTGPRGIGPALGSALGGAATAAFLKRSVDTAVQLEKAEKAFRKVSGNLTRQQQGSFIENLNRFATSGRTLSTVEELRRSAATIAQAGVDKGGVQLLDRWVRFTEQASIAFDIPLRDATQQIIELTNALAGDRSLKEQYKEASRLSDIITHLGNNTASSEKKLLPFLHRVAGVTATFGISADNALAFGAALTGAGTPTEKAGTAFNAMLLILSDMNSASARAKEGLSRPWGCRSGN